MVQNHYCSNTNLNGAERVFAFHDAPKILPIHFTIPTARVRASQLIVFVLVQSMRGATMVFRRFALGTLCNELYGAI